MSICITLPTFAMSLSARAYPAMNRPLTAMTSKLPPNRFVLNAALAR
jgi:hypothetical protein